MSSDVYSFHKAISKHDYACDLAHSDLEFFGIFLYLKCTYLKSESPAINTC